jgi:hypothetical protein
MPLPTCTPTTLTCTNPIFARVTVSYLYAGNSTISWAMDPTFIDSLPWSFQLQVGHTGSNLSTDWTNVGAPVVNGFTATDPNPELWGKTPDAFYRLVLTTPGGTYTSDPANVLGDLDQRAWLYAQEIVRKEQLRHSVLSSPNGSLLIAKRYGPVCTECIDTLTNEPTQTNCPTCFGIGYEGGFWAPVPNVYCDLSQTQSREHRDPQRGQIRELTQPGRLIWTPGIEDLCVWVNQGSDQRYFVQGIEPVAAVRGVTIVVAAQLRLIPTKDLIYTIAV